MEERGMMVFVSIHFVVFECLLVAVFVVDEDDGQGQDLPTNHPTTKHKKGTDEKVDDKSACPVLPPVPVKTGGCLRACSSLLARCHTQHKTVGKWT